MAFRGIYLDIVEQPKQRGMRFRYECEGRSAGSIPGENTTGDKKTWPSCQIVNYQGPAIMRVSLVTKDDQPKPHPHSLVGRDCNNGVCQVNIDPGNQMLGVFPNLGIQCVRRKEVGASIRERLNQGYNPFGTAVDGDERSAVDVDLNIVRLCFEAFLPDQDGNYTRKLHPVVSNPIYDKKATSSSVLKICRVDKTHGSVQGNEEIFLLCDKVQKEDIQVVFYCQGWEALGDFSSADVHRQVAIVFKTPAYKDKHIEQSVEVQFMLRRPSDMQTSSSLLFTYLPRQQGLPSTSKFPISLRQSLNHTDPRRKIIRECIENRAKTSLHKNSEKFQPIQRAARLQPPSNFNPSPSSSSFGFPTHQYKARRLGSAKSDSRMVWDSPAESKSLVFNPSSSIGLTASSPMNPMNRSFKTESPFNMHSEQWSNHPFPSTQPTYLGNPSIPRNLDMHEPQLDLIGEDITNFPPNNGDSSTRNNISLLPVLDATESLNDFLKVESFPSELAATPQALNNDATSDISHHLEVTAVPNHNSLSYLLQSMEEMEDSMRQISIEKEQPLLQQLQVQQSEGTPMNITENRIFEPVNHLPQPNNLRQQPLSTGLQSPGESFQRFQAPNVLSSAQYHQNPGASFFPETIQVLSPQQAANSVMSPIEAGVQHQQHISPFQQHNFTQYHVANANNNHQPFHDEIDTFLERLGGGKKE